MADVVITDLCKVYEGGVVAVDRVSLSVGNGEFLVLVGPSGCGKSTTLRMVAGLETITSGEIRINGKVVNDLPPKDRDIAMVFQNYALYPHMSVFENMAFGLRLRKLPWAEIDSRVGEAAEILGLQDLLKRLPKQLSGGQRQRVAVGRAIVRKPKVFLFDEPLSNLDAKMRVEMRGEIHRLHKRLGATMIYVTHDQTEAMTMGDRIVVMNRGVVLQADAPLTVYNRPANLFTAGFIGMPPMNFIEQEKTVFGFRPEDALISDETDGFGFEARAELIEPMGAETFVHLSNGTQIRVQPEWSGREGDSLRIRVRKEKIHVFDRETGARV